MKKLTLSVGLLIGVLSTNAQDTTCTYFKGKRVIEFDYYNSEILYEVEQTNKYHTINLKYGDVLCLDLSDDKKRVRKVIVEYFDGSTTKEVLDSKDHVYYSPLGATKVLVGRPKFACRL